MTDSALVEVVITESDWPADGKNADGLIRDWEVQAGDSVQAGDQLAEAVVVKTAIEIVSPVDGVEREVMVAKNQLFKPNTPLAVIEESP